MTTCFLYFFPGSIAFQMQKITPEKNEDEKVKANYFSDIILYFTAAFNKLSFYLPLFLI